MFAALGDDTQALEYLLKMEMACGNFNEAQNIGKFLIPRILSSEGFDDVTMDQIETTYGLFESESGVLPYALEGWKEYSNCEALAHLIVHHERFEPNKKALKQLRSELASMGPHAEELTKARRNLEYAVNFAKCMRPTVNEDSWYVSRCKAALVELRAVKPS